MSPDSLSLWLTLAGFVPRRWAAWCWVVCGIGWGGVAWQRATEARISRHMELTKGFTPHGFATHMPQLVFGIVRLSRR